MEVWMLIGVWLLVGVGALIDWSSPNPYHRLIWVLKRVMGPFYPGKDRLP